MYGSYFASANLLSSLGIDWKLLVTQGIAFLILLYVLKRFVYPVLLKSIDERREAIEAGLKEAEESHKALEKAEERATKLLAEARKDVEDLITRSQQEGAQIVNDAEVKAKQRADQIVADARLQLEADVRRARNALKQEAIGLVVAATEHVVGERIDTKKDEELIKKELSREPTA